MRTIIKILLISLLTSNVFSQTYQSNLQDFNKELLTYKPKKKKKYLNPEIGYGMLIGGAVFTISSLATDWVYVGGSTTEKQPFYHQPKLYTVATGAILLTSGLIYLKFSL